VRSGPKRREGDRQAPEGFYAVTPGLMNPNSAHYLSFDTGFPNAYDRAQGATGSALMVHGTCSSAGCYAMTDEGIAEIYALLREAFAGGQRAVQLQAYPFRMTPENLVRHRLDPNIAFWRQLKEGSDRFEATGEEPLVTVRAARYAFLPYGDPAKERAVAHYRAQDEDHAAVILDEGRPAVRTTYADGGQHPHFAALARKGAHLGEVSRPEALAAAGREVVVAQAKPPRPRPPTRRRLPSRRPPGPPRSGRSTGCRPPSRRCRSAAPAASGWRPWRARSGSCRPASPAWRRRPAPRKPGARPAGAGGRRDGVHPASQPGAISAGGAGG
jgi:hypothetical protein